MFRSLRRARRAPRPPLRKLLKKRDQNFYQNGSSLEVANPLTAFLLQEGGAREKLAKENAVRDVSLSAESEEGYAPSTAQAFEKA